MFQQRHVSLLHGFKPGCCRQERLPDLAFLLGASDARQIVFGTPQLAGRCLRRQVRAEVPQHTTELEPTHQLAFSENVITVGAINDDGTTIAGFSSTGPADDGRIKPDVVANGVGLTPNWSGTRFQRSRRVRTRSPS